jgi:hypothetical protein
MVGECQSIVGCKLPVCRQSHGCINSKRIENQCECQQINGCGSSLPGVLAKSCVYEYQNWRLICVPAN